MEADVKQQKVHNQEPIQALLLGYNRPSLTKCQVGSVSTFGCVLRFPFFQLLSKCTLLRFDFFVSATTDKIFCIQNNKIKNIVTFKIMICTEQDKKKIIEFKVVNIVAVVTYKPF